MWRKSKYILETGDIEVTANCTVDKYEDHNYIKEKIIKDKIKKNTVTTEEMEDYLHQKIYFQESYIDYPTLTYNQIAINLVEKYEVKKLVYTYQNFNVFKSTYNKKFILIYR